MSKTYRSSVLFPLLYSAFYDDKVISCLTSLMVGKKGCDLIRLYILLLIVRTDSGTLEEKGTFYAKIPQYLKLQIGLHFILFLSGTW